MSSSARQRPLGWNTNILRQYIVINYHTILILHCHYCRRSPLTYLTADLSSYSRTWCISLHETWIFECIRNSLKCSIHAIIQTHNRRTWPDYVYHCYILLITWGKLGINVLEIHLPLPSSRLLQASCLLHYFVEKRFHYPISLIWFLLRFMSFSMLLFNPAFPIVVDAYCDSTFVSLSPPPLLNLTDCNKKVI